MSILRIQHTRSFLLCTPHYPLLTAKYRTFPALQKTLPLSFPINTHSPPHSEVIIILYHYRWFSWTLHKPKNAVYVVFWEWLPVLHIRPVRAIQLCTTVIHSLLLLCGIYSTRGLCHHLVVHFTTDRRFSSFPFLPIMNGVAMNTLACVF